ncbi:MAG: aldose 1-epimerase [Candidatus Latescibacteria bacterium]|nr:aldose 1-epimerase [Candidatus Latescibacterota bacterium]
MTRISLIIIIVLLLAGCENRKGDNMRYSYCISQDSTTGWNIIQLNAENPADSTKNISIKVVPHGGNNMFSFTAGGRELIKGPEELINLLNPKRGNPILYPTPNRVVNGRFEFLGESYTMQVPGEENPRTIHGLVWDAPWEFSEPEVHENGVILATWYEFSEDNPRFQAFPFFNTIRVTYTVFDSGVRIAYEVKNNDKKPLGFGFAVHPFWQVIGDKSSNKIQVALPYHMEAAEKIPTGKLEPVEGTDWNLYDPTPVSELDLDDVYYGATPESVVRVIYESIGLELQQKATADFSHVVVYTPDTDFFCIENQTCSTNAHNLYAQGFKKESHLQIVQPGKTTGGHVEYTVVKK